MRLICWCSGIAYSGCETFRNGSADVKGLRFGDAQETRFRSWSRSYMGSAILQRGLYADVLELRFETAKLSEMDSAVSQGCWFANAQETRIRFEKRSNMGNAVMKELQFDDAHEPRFQASNLSDTLSVIVHCFRFPYVWNFVFKLRNVQIRTVPSSKSVDLLMIRNRVNRVRTFRYMKGLPAIRLISWYSGIAYSGCLTFRNGHCSPARGLICWWLRIACSGCESLKYG